MLMAAVIETTNWRIMVGSEPLNAATISTRAVPRQAVPFDPELHSIQGELEQLTASAVFEAQQDGRKVGAGPQFGLASYEVRDGTLDIVLKPVTYYTNLQDWKLAKSPVLQRRVMEVSNRVLEDPLALFGRVLAANATIQLLREGAQDSYQTEIESGKVLPEEAYSPILVSFRDPTQFEYWLAFHNVGGHPKKEDTRPGEQLPDWNLVMRNQIKKELGVDPSSIVYLELLGLAENVRTRKPDLLYFSRLNLAPSQVLASQGGEEKEELQGLIPVEGFDELYELLEHNQSKGRIYTRAGSGMDGVHRRMNEFMMRRQIDRRGLDPNTDNNFCPVGEACMALVLQKRGYNVSPIYSPRATATSPALPAATALTERTR